LQSVQFMSIPFPLKLIAIVVIILVILLVIVVRKKQRRLIFPLILLLVLTTGFGVWKGLSEYNRTNEDLADVKADINISATDLVRDYEKNDSIANNKYLGKVIEIKGRVKKLEPDDKGYLTVILGDTANSSSVRCSMDTLHNTDAAHLEPGSSAILRGFCTGFNKDEIGLGSDVILNRCAVVTKKD
jgi:putative nucleic acid binding protein